MSNGVPDFCPFCGADFKGAPIPEDKQCWYGGDTHFSRCIALYDPDLDRTTAWQCPDCEKTFPRKQ